MQLFPSLQLLLAAVSLVPSVSAAAATYTNGTSTSTTSLNSQTSSVMIPPDSSTSETSTVSYHSQTATVTTSLPPAVSTAVFPTVQPKWILKDNHIISGKGDLPQYKQNGNSWLGSLQAPKYPPFIGANGNSNNYPWGGKTAKGTDPYTSPPDTGVTRAYNFVVERGTLQSDGVVKDVILINGEFPGPTIEANWGDTIEVTVTNKISNPEEGTSLHWHGLLQTGTPFMDGVPGISQCPIAPGLTFTYSFKADLYGSSWYHSHYSAQYAAGVFGALIIHGPTDNTHYDEDLGPVLLTDYYHQDYFTLVERTMGTDLKTLVVFSDNNLINGKGIFNCSLAADPSTCDPNAGLSKFHFQRGKSYRLRLINAGAEGTQKFSIDNHKLTVIAYDFVPINPYETEVITLGIGQRADIVVTASGSKNDVVWMRSSLTKCANTYQPNALAMIYYDNADSNAKPNSTAWVDNTDPCANDDIAAAVPFYSITPDSNPELELEIDVGFGANSTGHYVFTMNNSTFRVNYNKPILPLAEAGKASDFPTEWNVYDLGASKSVRITLNNLTPIVHPMHIHGHNFQVLSSLSHVPSHSTPVSVVNPQNPYRRDTHILPPKGQIVLQFAGDNPGVWPLHCHIAWHVSGGLYVNLLEDKNGIMRSIHSPSAVSGLCDSWEAYTNREVVDQIDSGLKA